MNSKVITGGRQTTAQKVRDVGTDMINSCLNKTDDADVNSGYISISVIGFSSIATLKSVSSFGYYHDDTGNWSAPTGTNGLSQVLAISNTTQGNPINLNDNDEIQLGDSRIGLIQYSSFLLGMRLRNATSTDSLLFSDSGGIDFSSTTYLAAITGPNSILCQNAFGIVLDSNSTAKLTLSETTGKSTLFSSVEIILNSPLYTFSTLTASTVPYLDAGKRLVSSSVTPTELGYVSGVTSAIQTQINALQTGQFWKQACRVATTAAGTLATSFENGDTIDGVVLVTGDRLLIKDQAAALENGIYVVNASGAPTRSTDFDAQADNLSGATVTIQEGTANSEKKFTCSTNNPITIGVTSITFIDAGGVAMLGTTNRITVTGNVIDIAATYVGQASITTLGTVTTATYQATSISTTYTDAKIKGSLTGTLGLISFANGTADTVTNNANFLFDSVNSGLILGTTAMLATTDLALFNKSQNTFSSFVTQNTNASGAATVGFRAYNGTSSANLYQTGTGYTTAGQIRANETLLTTDGVGGMGFYSASSNANAALYFYNAATLRLTISATGLYTLTNAVASTHNCTMINTTSTNGAYCQYTVSNNVTVINLGMVGPNTTTSGVYVIGEAYNMTTSTGYSTGTLHASGTYRIYTANGVLASTIDTTQRTGIGVAAGSITAYLHIRAGAAGAGLGQIKLASGTKLTVAEAGVAEYNGNLYFSNATTRFSVGGVLPFDNFADVSVGGAETDIYTGTLLASTFNVNGDKTFSMYGGNFVTVGTELTQLKVYFAGTAIWDSTAIAPSTGTTSWRVVVELERVSSTVIRYTVSLNTTGATGYVYCTVGELTGLTLSNTNILKITGTSSGVGSGAGDIVGKMSYTKINPAS